MLKSGVYEGVVRHRRMTPVAHAFQYSLCMMYLDLDEIPQLFRRRWLWSDRRLAAGWFRRADHLGAPTESLADSVRKLVGDETGHTPSGPIRLLTQLRYWGFVMNPVSFFYCFDAADSRIETVVAEVNNTPWGERHCYVLPFDTDGGRTMKIQHNKEFHVSPFMDMNMSYAWRISSPGDALSIHIENRRGSERLFDATMVLRRREWSTRALNRVLIRYPFMTLRIFAAIYWQALRLWIKKVPVHNHPSNYQTQEVISR